MVNGGRYAAPTVSWLSTLPSRYGRRKYKDAPLTGTGNDVSHLPQLRGPAFFIPTATCIFS